jgi:hypothetical protein
MGFDMDDSQRIGVLRHQIEEANGGRPSDFKGWRQRTAAAVRAVMGADHPFAKELDNVGYSLMMFTDQTPQSDFDRARESGVRSAIAILEGAIH